MTTSKPQDTANARRRLGERIRRQLQEHNLPQSALARHLGKNDSWLKDLVRGKVSSLEDYRWALAQLPDAVSTLLATTDELERWPHILDQAMNTLEVTKTYLCQCLNCHPSTLSRLLQGQTRWKQDYMLAANALSLPSDWHLDSWVLSSYLESQESHPIALTGKLKTWARLQRAQELQDLMETWNVPPKVVAALADIKTRRLRYILSGGPPDPESYNIIHEAILRWRTNPPGM